MATLDIRNEALEPINKIRFTDDENEVISKSIFRDYYVDIEDSDGDTTRFHKNNLPNLIKALQKAHELWFPEVM